MQYIVYKHKDPTNNDFWYPPYMGPWNQNVRSLCLRGLRGHYLRKCPFRGLLFVWVQQSHPQNVGRYNTPFLEHPFGLRVRSFYQEAGYPKAKAWYEPTDIEKLGFPHCPLQGQAGAAEGSEQLQAACRLFEPEKGQEAHEARAEGDPGVTHYVLEILAVVSLCDSFSKHNQ